ncbi:MAG: hypothetical protein ACP5LW_04165 [Nitrososphaeria archaeon]
MNAKEIVAKILTVPVILLGIYVFLLSYSQNNAIIKDFYYLMSGILWFFSALVLLVKVEDEAGRADKQPQKRQRPKEPEKAHANSS